MMQTQGTFSALTLSKKNPKYLYSGDVLYRRFRYYGIDSKHVDSLSYGPNKSLTPGYKGYEHVALYFYKDGNKYPISGYWLKE